MIDQIKTLSSLSYLFLALALVGGGLWISSWFGPPLVMIDGGFILFIAMAGIFALLRAVVRMHERVASLEARLGRPEPEI